MLRSRAKSSAANMRPDRRGLALHIWSSEERERADSMSARMETDEVGRGLGRVESVWLTTSVMKWRSEGDWTLGTTRVVRLGDLSCVPDE